ARDTDTQITVTLSEIAAEATIDKLNDGGFIVAETLAPATTYTVSSISPLVAGNDDELVLSVADMSVSAEAGVTITYTAGGYPVGTITDTVINTLEFAIDDGDYPHVINVLGDVYAIVYQGFEGDGFLKTVTISADGTIISAIESQEFDTADCVSPRIINVSGDVYAIVYEGVDLDGYIKTVTISDAGDITDTVIDTLEFDAADGVAPYIINVSGDVYAIVYRGVDLDGYIKTVEISSTQTYGTVTDVIGNALATDAIGVNVNAWGGNNAPTATAPVTSQATDGSGLVTIETTIDDTEDDDTCWFKVEYSLDGGGSWISGDPYLSAYITTSPDQATE
ncbi:MAG: hypothetical protein KAI25_08330, partial [Hyphomicrobiaceae bacterium]|nr:hypothetical protein [Hyphomicrobiaceae bacterium]